MDLELSELKKENNWHFETTNFTISDKKCGEIFVQTNEEFYIVCTFCIIRFTEFDQFTTHYSHSHGNESALHMNNTVDFIKSEPENDSFRIKSSNAILEISQHGKNIENSKATVEPHTVDDIKSSSKQGDILYISRESKSEIPQTNLDCISTVLEGSKILQKKSRRRKTSHYRCDSCEKMFTTETKLEDHKKYDHLSSDDPFLIHMLPDIQLNPNSDDSENDDENKTKPEEIQQIKVDPKKCRYCNREFGHRFERIQHERTNHTGEKPFKCTHCDKSFASLSYCKEHEKFHLGIKPHKCDLCDASFGKKSNLSAHVRRHKGEKSHSCSFCEKKFFDNAEKVIHERTHTGEKPYQCITCGKCFTTSSQLFYHRKLHHSIGIEKPHICETCNKSFTTKRMLKEHSIWHSDLRPFKCEICSKAFKCRKGLKSHEKIHSDATNYTCNICGKGFKQYSGLYCHTKVHEKVV